MSAIDQMLFGPGTCKRCRLIKPLVMVEVPGLHEDEETGELDGGTLHLHPLDEQRLGFCHDCAPAVLKEITRKDA